MKSFSLLRTNVGLTTNLKVVVDSNYNLSMNSIDSKEELGNVKFKKVSFIKTNYYDELIPHFYDKLPPEIAFSIKYDNDADSMSNDYSLQYDEIYEYGARNIINNKDYSEEYEYFAPLYISPNFLPKKFIIFRVDGSGIDILNNTNVENKIFKKFKTVKIFDLTKLSPLGEWLDLNFNNNEFFPLCPFEMSFDNLEFSKWNGIDYETGGYTSKSFFLESIIEEEKEIYELEKFIFNGYKNNKVVFPNILNLSFLFDDSPADSDGFKKWSLNRYYGFYLDDIIEHVTISPYNLPPIKPDVLILDENILYSPTGDPFVDGFIDDKVYYIEYSGQYYKVEKFTQESDKKITSIKRGRVITEEYLPEITTKYRIISDIDLSGKQLLINKNFGTIGSSETYSNRLLNYDGSNLNIEDWDTADVWIIEIDGVYHNLIKESGPELINGSYINTERISINSDYSFSIENDKYTYWISKNDPKYTTSISLIVDEYNTPKKFTIYKLKFTDIKDFDTRIVDTEYSKFEYEKKYDLTNTDETKMYFTNLYSKSIPKDLDDFIYKGEVVNIPVSSEYASNYESFKIENGELSDIWRKNSVYCRWAFQNSLSSNDSPYLLNNSLIFEDYNRTANPFMPSPKRIERNLDYFYTINSSTSSYIHHTLHIENNINGEIDSSFKFEIDKYLNLGSYNIGTYSFVYNFDYFSYLFDRSMTFDSGKIKKNVKKYSLFNSGDISIPNITLFRGIKFIIYDVEDIKKDKNGKLSVLNLKTSNTFDDYKFSILLSKNQYSVINIDQTSSQATMSSATNSMSWSIVQNWQMDTTYNMNDVVIMDDILYISTINNNIIEKPNKDYGSDEKAQSAPYNQLGWTYSSSSSIFWDPNRDYLLNEFVYNNGDYYLSIGTHSQQSYTYNWEYIGINSGPTSGEFGSLYSDFTTTPCSFYLNATNSSGSYIETFLLSIPNGTSVIISGTSIDVIPITNTYSYSWEYIGLTAPNNGDFSSENIDLSTSSYFYVSATNSSGLDVGSILGSITNGSSMIITGTSVDISIITTTYSYTWKYIGDNPLVLSEEFGSQYVTFSNTPCDFYLNATYSSGVDIRTFLGSIPSGTRMVISGTSLGGTQSSNWEYFIGTSSVTNDICTINCTWSSGDSGSPERDKLVDIYFYISSTSSTYTQNSWSYLIGSQSSNNSIYTINCKLDTGPSASPELYTLSDIEFYILSTSSVYTYNNWSYLISSSSISNGIFTMDCEYYSGPITTPEVNTISDITFNIESKVDDFWNPITSNIGYNLGDIVLFMGNYFMSTTSSNHYRPDYQNSFLDDNNNLSYYWIATQSSNPIWRPIYLWNPSIFYNSPTYAIHNNILYSCPSLSRTGNEPGISDDWISQYTLDPSSDVAYNNNLNPVIEMNNSYYLINSNTYSSTLDNGVNIYINKKWKNVLINISINDNTIPNLSETDRDDMYNELSDKLTAYNIIRCINDLSNKYGFIDYLNYIIIDEDNNIFKYNYNRLEGLPHYIICEYPDEVKMKVNSLTYNKIDLPIEAMPKKVLKSVDNSLTNINYYNNVPPSVEIKSNPEMPEYSPNYHGYSNVKNDIIYRFSGFYMPIFYDIQLFLRSFFTYSVGNYKFDTSLTEFGISKERKIRKINHNGNILKLGNSKDKKSIYPMIDEYGYTFIDYFIFKSSWDLEYNYITEIENIDPILPSTSISISSIGKQN